MDEEIDFNSIEDFQEYIYNCNIIHNYKGIYAHDLSEEAYLNDTTNVDAIKQGSISLLSDMNFGYAISKAVSSGGK